jgi:GNAT superfamily N-acetyltransferase
MTDQISYEAIKVDEVRNVATLRSDNDTQHAFWENRITAYLQGIHHPQHALAPRVIYVARQDGKVLGFIAGHLSTRYQCEGELQWVDVLETNRREGIATALLAKLAGWFQWHNAKKICVDAANDGAKAFYEKSGAKKLNEHWLYWDDITSRIQ